MLALVVLAALAAGARAGEEAGQQARLAGALLGALGAAPGRAYRLEEALLVAARRTANNAYDIEINVKAVDPNDPQKYKLLKCHGELTECADTGQLSVIENTSGCVEEAPLTTESTKERDNGGTEQNLDDNMQVDNQETVQDIQTSWEGQSEEDLEITTEAEIRAIKLDHEVLPGNQITSGEQFVAVRREHTGPSPCIGCSSFVDVTAPGVDDLAVLAVKHIDRHEPAQKHRLNKVLVVERQVQVVNGVRYILTLNVDYDNCSLDNLDNCLQTKTCRVSILEKPWLKLPNGSKFRAIVSNNCTNEYLFGDNGEVLSNIPESSHENRDNEIDVNFNPDANSTNDLNHNSNKPTPDYDAIANSGAVDDILKVVQNTDLQANIPQKERELTPDEMKTLEEQIIPNSDQTVSQSTTEHEQVQDHKIEAYVADAEPSAVQTHVGKEIGSSIGHTPLSEDQQKALDGLLDYFDTRKTIAHRRARRNVEVADKLYIRKLAQYLVDTLNTFDAHVKNRILVEVLSADEERTNGKHTFYIRVKVAFPTQITTENKKAKICNAMIDVSNNNVPRVLKSFCNEDRRSKMLGGRRQMDKKSDEILQLIQQSLAKIEAESLYNTKLKVLNVLSADKQVVSGTLTRISLELGFTNCPKSKPVDIANCDLQNDLGSTICKVHSLNKPWLKSNTITFECVDSVPSTSNQQTVKTGSAIEGNVDDPQIIKLAQESLQKFELTSENDNKLKIVKIYSITNQVVAGTLTKIIYDVALTKCSKENDATILDQCELLENSPTYRCEASIWNRPWIQDGKKISVICDNDLKKRAKRDQCGIPGGACQQNANDPEFVQLAKESLQELEKISDSVYRQKVVEITFVSTQVVSGVLTSIDFSVGLTKCMKTDLAANIDSCELLEDKSLRQCHSKIWTRLWLHGPDRQQITVTCDDDAKKRAKRECDRPGGACPVDESDPENIELAKKSLEVLEQLSTSEYRQKLVKVKHVTSQVVAGTMTTIDFDVGYTKCRKTDLAANIDSCELLEDKSLRQCHSKIWTRLWLHGPDRQQITVTCEDNVHKRAKRNTNGNNCEAPGVVCTVDENDPENIKLVQESLQKLEKLSTSEYRQKIVNITSATKQFVEGTLTNIKFYVGYTKCLQNDLTSNLESCQLLSDKPLRQCHSEIWNRPWMKDGKEITVTCEDESAKPVQWNTACQLSGEPCETDKSAPEHIKLAEESLKKLQQLSDSEYKQKIVNIKSVKKQIVSGTLHKIDFDVGYTRCLVNDVLDDEVMCELLQDVPIRHCHSEIWNRPWIPDGKEINVTCDDSDSEDNKNSTCGLPGGVCIINIHNPENLKLAHDSLIELEKQNQDEYKMEIVEIRSVTRQVLKTIVTKIDFDVGTTECLIKDKIDDVDRNCPLLKDAPLRQCHSEITVTPWLENSRQINVTCNDNYKNFYLEYTINSPNGFSERSRRELPMIGSHTYGLEVMKLASQAVDILNSRQSYENALKLQKIRSLKRDMNNALIRINFDAAPTMCLTEDQLDLDECDFLDQLPIRHCHAKAWRRRNKKNRELSVYCDDELPMSLGVLIEGPWEKDGSSDKTENLKQAQLALEKLTDTDYKMKVLKILSVSKKVSEDWGKGIVFLAGYTNCSFDHPLTQLSQCKLIKVKPIKLCQAEIWTHGYMETTIQCDTKPRPKRSDIPKIVDPNDEIVHILAKDNLIQFELMSTGSSRLKVFKVNSALMLPGDKWKINFDVAYTKCSKYEIVENVDNCEPLLNAPHRQCISEVWKRNWLKQGFAVDITCNDKSDNKFDDYETALQLAELSMKHIEAKYIHPSKQTLVRVISMDKQVISGLHYRIKLEVGFTDCQVFDTRTDCNITNEYGANKFCKANIWLRPWLDQPPNIRVLCELGNNTLKADEIYLQLTTEKLFSKFLATHKPKYIDDRVEFNKRFNIFKNNIRRIHELNIHEKGTATYGITKFADLTYKEFKKNHTGLRLDLRSNSSLPQASIPQKETLPESFDWRQMGAVTEVKNQGSCGSCWAFSVTGNIEGQWFLKNRELVSLSEQELVDCDKLDEGCNGGLPDNAYRAIEQLGGLEKENDYPYDAENEKCKYNADKVAVRISSAVNISSNEDDMAKWLVQNGPISIGINANGMQFYMGGVSHPWKVVCNPKNLDHGVLIVGFGVKNYPLFHKQLPYWIVKNSWGTSWGEQGYYRVYRGDGTCGLNLMASSAVV